MALPDQISPEKMRELRDLYGTIAAREMAKAEWRAACLAKLEAQAGEVATVADCGSIIADLVRLIRET